MTRQYPSGLFEANGKHEDHDLMTYTKALRADGVPFAGDGANTYGSLPPWEFGRILRGEPKRRTKEAAAMRVADLMLNQMAKGGYDPTYKPYVDPMRATEGT